ncbi:MAG: C4-dicarboxylate ABC transporter substrate-binding protein [Ottowia sp.]|jgi:hypothetical protein|nr:C4-dicarboxylate ABC transporter substrate-binding protein [Ottowia sp.]
MGRRIKLFVLSIRDLIASAGPVAILAVGLLVAAYWWLDPQPPKTVRMATGPEGSAYAGFGRRYAAALEREGITVELIPTEGSVANLQLLRDGKADVAFVRGGSGAAPTTANASAGALPDAGPAAAAAASEARPAASSPAPGADPDDDGSLLSLGALFYEPVWIFYRPDALPQPADQTPTATHGKTALSAKRANNGIAHADDSAASPAEPQALAQIKGLRINVDQPGSGVPQLMQRLLRANGLNADEMTLSQLPPAAAAEALSAGLLDALVLTSAPQSAVVRQLLRAPGVKPLELAQADAYTRRFPFLRTVTLPRGVTDLAADIPPHDVTLLAATTSLLSREDTHPALRQLFAQAAQSIHSRAGWLNGTREFPNTRTSELAVSPEGERAINGAPSFWQRYLPFWASNLLDRMWLVIGGLIVLLLPLSRIVPPLYTFRVRRRVFRWYARLRAIEAKVDSGQGDRAELLNELDELDRVANQIAVPLAHADELYALRNNIHAVRKRLLAKQAA